MCSTEQYHLNVLNSCDFPMNSSLCTLILISLFFIQSITIYGSCNKNPHLLSFYSKTHFKNCIWDFIFYTPYPSFITFFCKSQLLPNSQFPLNQLPQIFIPPNCSSLSTVYAYSAAHLCGSLHE